MYAVGFGVVTTPTHCNTLQPIKLFAPSIGLVDPCFSFFPFS